MKTVAEILEDYPSKPLLVDGKSGLKLTGLEITNNLENLCSQLCKLGVDPGSKVGLCLSNSLELAALYLACLQFGYTAVALSSEMSPGDREEIVSRIGLSCVIVSAETAGPFNTLISEESAILLLDVKRVSDGHKLDKLIQLTSLNSPFTRIHTSSEETGPHTHTGRLICFSSGSTSRPKAIVHEATSLFSNATAFNRLTGQEHNLVALNVFPMSYMAGILNSLLCPLLAGGTVVLEDPFSVHTAVSFWKTLRRHQITFMWLNPTMVNLILKLDRTDDGPEYCKSKNPQFFVGTAPYPAHTRQSFEQLYNVETYQSYGLTEVLLVSTNHKGARKEHSVGRVIEGISVTPSVSECPSELVIKSNYQALGYLNYDTGKLEPISQESEFRTGDQGLIDEDGFLIISGRIKDIIIRGGLNISPQAIEDVLRQHRSIEEVAVIGVPHETFGEQVIAVVQCKEGETSATKQEIISWASNHLSRQQLPNQILFVDTLPRTSSGKVSKFQVRQSISGY
jgi:acyl-CoA synthetase (AMP-forming)/AMP-acid ligase II